MKKVILLIAVLAVIMAGWFLYFDEGEPRTIVSLHVATVTRLENALEFSGEVAPAEMYSVMSETGGTVSSLHVSEGRQVLVGDTLFELDSAGVAAQLEEARIRAGALEAAAAQAALAQRGGTFGLAQQKAKLALALSQTTGYDYESFNEALGADVAGQAQAVAASLAQSLSGAGAGMAGLPEGAAAESAQIELARLAVQRLEQVLAGMTCKSRLTGTVIAVNVNKGEVLAPGVPAMVIADTGNPVVVGYVYEKDVGSLAVDMDALIITDAGRFAGRIAKLGAAATGVSDLAAFDTMAKVQIVPQEGFSKMMGAVVDIKVVLSSKPDVLAIPIDCLTEDGCVFIVGEGDIAQKRAVVTGFEDAFYVEIVGGLEAGERIVATPKGIEEGQRLSYDRSL